MAEGALGTTASPAGASPPGLWTVSGFAPSLGSVANFSASLSRPSVETGGGVDMATAMSATPRARMRSITPTMAQAASQVCGTEFLGQKSPPPPPCAPAGRQASVALPRQEDGARISRSGMAGYQSLRGAPKDGR